MIKSEIIGKKEEEELGFPRVMECKTIDGLIVMFFKETSGVCLNKGKSPWTVGYFTDSWININDKSTWKPFHGEIKLLVT